MASLLRQLSFRFNKTLRGAYFWLGLIFILALFLRVYRLAELPYALHTDEVVNTYVGRFILLYGQDLWGNSWPLLHFDKFGDFPPVFPMYLSGLSTFILGVNEIAGRLPFALAGSLIVFPVFALSRRLFDEKLALLSALFISLTPWQIVLSRASAEGVLALTVFMFGLWLMIKAKETNQLKFLLFSILLWISTYFLYPGFRVTIPLVALGIPFFFKDKMRRITIVTAISFLVLSFFIGQTAWGKGRFDQTSVFYYNNQVQNRLQQFITSFESPSVFKAKLFHNKPLGFAREIAFQYTQYLSPSFLFARGGLPQRYSVPDQGLFYYSFALILALGFFSTGLTQLRGQSNQTFTRDQQKLFWFLVYVLLVSIIPAALTVDDSPNVHRSILLSVMMVFPLTLALKQIYDFKWGRLGLIYPICFLLLLEVFYFWHLYSGPTAHHQALVRGGDKRQHALYLKDHQAEYDRVYVSINESLSFYYLFYNNIFDSNLAGQLKPEMKIEQVGHISFLNTNCPSYFFPFDPATSTLIIDRSECDLNPYLTELKMIKRVNKTQAFRVLTPRSNILPSEFFQAQEQLRGNAKL